MRSWQLSNKLFFQRKLQCLLQEDSSVSAGTKTEPKTGEITTNGFRKKERHFQMCCVYRAFYIKGSANDTHSQT